MIATLRANPLPASPELPAARAVLGGKPVHILDVQAETGVHLNLVRQMGTRTVLVVPLLREGANIGSLTIWRDFVEPFTERQIELVKTFADQAVIAIENVRLFKNSGAQRESEALEQQTATSESAGRHQPLADGFAAGARRHCESAARVQCGQWMMVSCDIRDGDVMVPRSSYLPRTHWPPQISIEWPRFTGCGAWHTLHSRLRAQNEFPSEVPSGDGGPN